MKQFLLLLLIWPVLSSAQEDDPLKFFPYKTGNMWEYFFSEAGHPDTLQNFNIEDSIDAEGNIIVVQSARLINPLQPPFLFEDTNFYKIDSCFNVFDISGEWSNALVYKLNAQRGDQWVMWNHHGNGYDMVRVTKVWEDEVFGLKTKLKAFVYYFAFDSTVD